MLHGSGVAGSNARRRPASGGPIVTQGEREAFARGFIAVAVGMLIGWAMVAGEVAEVAARVLG